MLYNYTCNNCGDIYSRTNTIVHRKKGGRCPICTSSNTKQTTGTIKIKKEK